MSILYEFRIFKRRAYFYDENIGDFFYLDNKKQVEDEYLIPDKNQFLKVKVQTAEIHFLTIQIYKNGDILYLGKPACYEELLHCQATIIKKNIQYFKLDLKYGNYWIGNNISKILIKEYDDIKHEVIFKELTNKKSQIEYFDNLF